MRIPSAIAASCLSLLLAEPTVGQTTTLPVRAGEHADFTRLVIRLPEANDWRVITEGRRAQLRVSGPPLAFDLTQTFARIPRTRLRALRQEDDALILDLACLCDVRAAEDIPEYLVIDIVGETASLQALRAEQRPQARPGQPPAARTTDHVVTKRAGSKLAQALRGAQPTHAHAGSLLLAQAFGTQQDPAPLSPGMASDDLQDRLETMHRAITEELGQALAGAVGDGLLTSVPTPEPRQHSDATPAAFPVLTTLNRHVAIMGGKPNDDPAPPSVSSCPESRLLDVANWATDADLSITEHHISNLDAKLESQGPEAVLRLAKAYIAHGFGAEAWLVYSLITPEPEDRTLVKAMTRLVDLVPLRDENPFLGHADCGQGVELWLFLGQPGAEVSDRFDYTRLLQIVAALPPDLRLHLGPEIVERLVASGRHEDAKHVQATLDRVAKVETAPLRRARTRLDLLGAPPEEAERIEAALSPADNDDDLILLLARRDTDAQRLEETLMDLARTRLFALRGSPAGQELARLTIRALARAGDFEEAFALLDGRDATLPTAMDAALRKDLLQDLARFGTDREFVTLVFEQTPWELASLALTTREALSVRLSDLGFDIQAGLLRTTAPVQDVSDAATVPESPDILRARQAVAAQRAAPPADPPAAAASPEPAIEPDGIAPLAESLGPFMTARPPDQRSEDTVSDPDAAGPLAHGRDTLGQSADLRDRLEILLSDADLPDS